MSVKILNAALHPQKLILKTWHRLGVGSFKLKLDYDIFDRPHYAYCLYNAASLAHRLGYRRISAAEFGVAGGRGLLSLERLAAEIESELPVSIDIYGFDTGGGLPEPVDYRDLPYIWKAGFYQMDQDALRAKLTRSQLVLGDVKDTVPTFFEDHDPAPLAAVFLDLDFWSSTADALNVFQGPAERILPRVYCYCDDVISADGGGVLCEDVGQLRAIRDYNEASKRRKLRQIAGLSRTRRVAATWNDQIYVHHAFDHPDYNTYVHPDADRQLNI